MSCIKVCCLVCACVFAMPLLARQTTDSLITTLLHEVIVTGTRTERDKASLPMPVQVINKETIQKAGASRLSDIIREQTGLLTIPAFGGGEGIQLQGLDAAYTMILIDGQPLIGRSAGTLDLSRITVNNIDRIEIIKGASSSLYGSEALAGVVNIITKQVESNQQWHGMSLYRLASFNTHDASANVQYGGAKSSFDIFANYFSSGGYNLSDNNFLQTVEPFHTITVQPKVKKQLSEAVTVSLNSRYYAQNQDNKALISDEKFEGESKVREWNNTVLVNQQISKRWKIAYDVYASTYKAYEYLRNNNDQLMEESNYDQWFVRPEIRAHYKASSSTLTIGSGINYETLDRTNFSQRATLQSEYLFGQYEWFINSKLNVLTGFRYDHHRQYASQLSPKVGINYQLGEYINLKTSAGYGYKAPDARQLYFDFTNSSVGYSVFGYNVAADRLTRLQEQGQLLFTNGFDFSEPIKPESSFNYNLGATYQKKRLTMDINLFYNRISNLIDTKVVAQRINGQNVFSYFNTDRVFTYGMEANAAFEVTENLSFSAGYQYLMAKDQEVIDKISNEGLFARDPQTLSSFKLTQRDYIGLYNRSRHLINVKSKMAVPQWSTTFYARIFYRGQHGIQDSNSNAVLDRYDELVRCYWTVNLSVSKEFRHGLSLQTGANNLFDYTDPLNIPSIPGRQFFVTVQFTF